MLCLPLPVRILGGSPGRLAPLRSDAWRMVAPDRSASAIKASLPYCFCSALSALLAALSRRTLSRCFRRYSRRMPTRALLVRLRACLTALSVWRRSLPDFFTSFRDCFSVAFRLRFACRVTRLLDRFAVRARLFDCRNRSVRRTRRRAALRTDFTLRAMALFAFARSLANCDFRRRFATINPVCFPLRYVLVVVFCVAFRPVALDSARPSLRPLVSAAAASSLTIAPAPPIAVFAGVRFCGRAPLWSSDNACSPVAVPLPYRVSQRVAGPFLSRSPGFASVPACGRSFF